jgi:hypothetical protein
MKLFSVTPPEGTEHEAALVVAASGCTRKVFLVGKWALKVPTFYSQDAFLHGCLANLQERACWMIREIRPLLAPVVACMPLGLLLVMRRCEPMLSELTESEAKRFFYDCVKETGYSVPVEDKPSSFGYLDGRLVAVDYGS